MSGQDRMGVIFPMTGEDLFIYLFFTILLWDGMGFFFFSVGVGWDGSENPLPGTLSSTHITHFHDKALKFICEAVIVK